MSWFLRALNSSIGKKFVMAVTGICLILFLVIHLFNNLTLFAGPDIFNSVVKNLESIKPLIRIIEVVLLLIFIFHIFQGVVGLEFKNRKARPIKYAVNGSSKNSDLFSRTMIWSGSIVFIFLIVHLNTFWVAFNLGHPLAQNHNYYQIVVAAFQSPIYSGLYIIAMILLGFHLYHGFQSAFQTFGWNNKKYFPLIKKLGFIYSLIMAIGFTSIPVYFLFFYGGSI